MFTNECIGDLGYEGTTSAVVMAGIFLSFVVEYIGQRIVSNKIRSEAALTRKERSQALLSSEVVNILVMEAGIIFHSLREYPCAHPSRRLMH
jgi:solute carrier family 39 (zinc transporter), member 1/2/3